jgi:hypothetical protein
MKSNVPTDIEGVAFSAGRNLLWGRWQGLWGRSHKMLWWLELWAAAEAGTWLMCCNHRAAQLRNLP